MSTVKRFEDLEVWQEARRLSKEIIHISQATPLKNNFKLRDQIKASSGSVMHTIAQGFDRDSNIEFRQFLSIAKGSTAESRSQLYRVYDSGYITKEKRNTLTEAYLILNKRIAGFISYLNKKEYQGLKFKKNQTKN